ncbi:hypothetical protein [Nocardiopsis sp. CNT312]|uniref:hypothetical protein n=1 Tax=Nocardiopsis sp. CNT312 TaxID=1137268 RepID=UPI00048EFA00|nr:hypothetical protein [Nocardiopsis sp. CNT312]
MPRILTALAAVLLSPSALTACSDEPEGATAEQTEVEPSEQAQDAVEAQDRWPEEIPVPEGYELRATSDPAEGEVCAVNVFGVSSEDRDAGLAGFEADGFAETAENQEEVGGTDTFESDEWEVVLVVMPAEENGNPTAGETDAYAIGCSIGAPA